MPERRRRARGNTNPTGTTVPVMTTDATAESPASSIGFSAVLQQATGKKATGIVVPPEVIDRLDAGKKPPVSVTRPGQRREHRI